MTATIQDSYRAALSELAHGDLDRCKAVLGLGSEGGDPVIPFYDEAYRLSKGAFIGQGGQAPTDAVGLVLCRYLLNCPDAPPPKGRRLTFRELDGAGPLVSSFATNTNKIITSAYARDFHALEAAGRQMGGTRQDDPPGYDLVMRFPALPRVSVDLQFNAADDLFPAQCTVLFDQSAQVYLDMQSLFILGTYLAGGLVRHKTTGTA